MIGTNDLLDIIGTPDALGCDWDVCASLLATPRVDALFPRLDVTLTRLARRWRDVGGHGPLLMMADTRHLADHVRGAAADVGATEQLNAFHALAGAVDSLLARLALDVGIDLDAPVR